MQGPEVLSLALEPEEVMPDFEKALGLHSVEEQ
jgi:hypothetical protein